MVKGKERKTDEMWVFGQRMMSQYAEESDGPSGVKHTRKPLHKKMSQADFQQSLDEARQLSADITARFEGARAAGTKYFCLGSECGGYDDPGGSRANPTCPCCGAEHCFP
ncbi:MAG: hypothetical protein HN846_02660 [Candidatus Pacebacteria bacterium]|jgi:hypothetical protein|nr:hypothetical protein [Candidatus Paceibacterota bacterium]MBT3511763.1 hypothetical protein [Candidatus Paceibacterota bacterium]MBT4005188.1 hypothetical protein [Candidatus Paceibacterota bacterium]MBT4359014.1 hypothetical protein [Candidatus Paceibacterota bacterium]MBT4681289.1 hypothetical protein [Candidatus Paceibacterota bacterium]